MMEFENDIYMLSSVEAYSFNKIVPLLEKEGIKIAKWFGFSCFPCELKIHIYIENKSTFQSYIQEKKLCHIPEDAIAFAVNGNEVHILDYASVEYRFIAPDYTKIILHECIHILQGYYSKVKPSECIWLYESVACFLAKQMRTYPFAQNVSWNMFISNFYKIDNCYGLAYKYGRQLFRFYSENEILQIIKCPFKYMEDCKKIFEQNVYNLE